MFRIWLTSLNSRFRKWRNLLLIMLFCLSYISFSLLPARVQAQNTNNDVKQAEDQVIREFALPQLPAQPPVYQPEPTYSEPTYSEPAYSEPASEPAYSAPAPVAAPPAAASVAQRPAPKKRVEPAKAVKPSQYIW